MKKYLIIFILLLFTFNIKAQISELWGTTRLGGTYNFGTIFKINVDGTGFQSVYSFDTSSGSGCVPWGGLLKASDGLLYGLALGSGTYNGGSLYSIDPVSYVFTTLYLFNHNGSLTGRSPCGTLIQAANGLLYGCTAGGGSTNDGTIFSYDINSNTLSNVYNFDSSNGGGPRYIKLLEYNGLFYGLTFVGGIYSRGVIFSFNPNTNAYNDLYDFGASGTGFNPEGSIIDGGNGLLYGYTYYGGSYGSGTLFSFNPANNSVAYLKSFTNPAGSNPRGSPLLVNRKLYGLIGMGGPANCGVLSSYDLITGIYDTLVGFISTNYACGFHHGTLIEGNDGKLYAPSDGGGPYSQGCVFSFDTLTKAITDLVDFNTTNGKFPSGDLIELKITLNGNQIINNECGIKIFPNPFIEKTTIETNIPKHVNNCSLIIYNMLGEEVKRFNISSSFNKIEISYKTLNPGFYIAGLKIGNELKKSLRFVKLE